jgi:hypothetical protein
MKIDANSYRCYIVSSSFMIVVELAINGKALMCVGFRVLLVGPHI